MPFALELPFRDRSRSGTPETPRQLRAWLADFAVTDPGDAAGRIAELIDAQNQLALSPQRRLHLLETILPHTRAPIDALTARVQAQSLPLPARTAEAARLTRRLIAAVLGAYETVAAATPSGRSSRRAVALVTERALRLRGELLTRHLEADEPVPPGFWQHGYTMYALAESAAVARRRVRDRDWGGPRRPSPTDAFVSLMLLALAHPRGLRSGEAARIQRATQDWCRDARLAPAAAAPRDAAERGSVFAVALDAVTAPSQWRLRPGEGRGEDRVLDLARVVERVERLYQQATATGTQPPASTDGIGPTGLKRLLDNWNPRPLTGGPAAGEPATVVFGLERIQQRLEGGSKQARRGPARRYTQLRPSEVLQTIAENDPAEQHAYPHARTAVERPETVAPQGATADAAFSGWLLEEADAAGFRLRWQGAGRSRASVGDLVGVRTEEVAGDGARKTPRWRLGVVRWLQFVDEEHFAIGCELLSARPQVATVRHEPLDRHRRTSPREAGEPALLIPGESGGAEGSTVLVPSNRFRSQEILELDAGEHTLRVQFAALREHSTYFALFELAPAPARGRTSGVPDAAGRGRTLAG